MAMNQINKIIEKSERSIFIVRGYHEFIRPPEIVINEGVVYRLSFVLNTYRRNKNYWFLDVELFLSLVSKIKQLFDPCSTEVFMTNKSVLKSIELMKQKMLSESEEYRSPPRRIIFRNEGDVVCCIIDVEFWVNVGGPMPYHDSYTVSVYTKKDMSEQLILLCDDVCNVLNGTITGIADASQIPKKHKKGIVGFWHKWMRSK
jgi:hypothetical protein